MTPTVHSRLNCACNMQWLAIPVQQLHACGCRKLYHDVCGIELCDAQLQESRLTCALCSMCYVTVLYSPWL